MCKILLPVKFILSILVIITFQSCDLFFSQTEEWDIRWIVEGTASSVNVTIGVGDTTQQYASQSVPFEADSEAWGRRWFYYLSAQNNQSAGSVTVRLEYRAKGDSSWIAYEEATSTGGFTIATISGSFNP